MVSHNTIGIIGGEGQLPILAYDGVLKRGETPFLIAISGITPHEIKKKFSQQDGIELGLFQIGKLIRACKRKNIKKILFVGRIQHKSLYSLKWWKADFTSIRFLLSLSDWRADTVLGSLADLLGRHGIEVESTVVYLKDYLAPKGLLNGLEPTESEWKDVIFGYDVAKELSRVDAGQTVVVKKKAIVALEGMEGTDLCIERAGTLSGPGSVLVKVAKPNQDERFDVPVIGLRTIRKMQSAGVSVLAVEAQKTLIVDPAVYDYAKEHGIKVVAIEEPSISHNFR